MVQIVIILLVVLGSAYFFYQVRKDNAEIRELEKENEKLKKQKEEKLREISENMNYFKNLGKK